MNMVINEPVNTRTFSVLDLWAYPYVHVYIIMAPHWKRIARGIGNDLIGRLHRDGKRIEEDRSSCSSSNQEMYNEPWHHSLIRAAVAALPKMTSQAVRYLHSLALKTRRRASASDMETGVSNGKRLSQ